MKLGAFRSVSLAAAVTAALAPMLALSRSASAQPVPIYGGPTYNQTTGDGFNNASFSNSTGMAVNSSGVAVGLADRNSAGVNMLQRAVFLNSAGAAGQLTGLTTDPAVVAESAAYSINAAGQMVGFANKHVGAADVGDRAVRWDAAGNPFELGNLGTDASGVTDAYAYSINAAGQSVGSATKFTSGSNKGARAVRWDATGHAFELGDIVVGNTGTTSGSAYSINAANQSAGFMSKYNGNQYKGDRAVSWDAAGVARELNSLGLSNQSVTNAYAFAINASAQVVGYSAKYVSGSLKGDRAVRWNADTGTALELATLGTDGSGTTYSYGFAINDARQTAGRAFKYVGGTSKGERAVRWDAAGKAFELGDLGLSTTGSTSASALSINSLGEVVGRSKKYVGGVDQGDRAVYWTSDGAAVDLNTLIDPSSNWTLTRARAITDNGWVTGFGLFDPDGAGGPLAAYQRQFLLKVASESAWLNAAGGTWQTGGNWSASAVPGPSVDPLFNLGSTYSVNLTSAGTARALIVRSDNVTLNLGGNTLVAASLIVGRDSGDNANVTTNGGGTLTLKRAVDHRRQSRRQRRVHPRRWHAQHPDDRREQWRHVHLRRRHAQHRGRTTDRQQFDHARARSEQNPQDIGALDRLGFQAGREGQQARRRRRHRRHRQRRHV
jgi:hypothetical protein